MFNLIIVESPAKCKKIEHFLKSEYPKENFKVVASKGHIEEIKNPGLNIDLKNNFNPTYIFKKSNKQIKEIQNLYKNAKDIYLATDLDFSGSFISWSICKLLNLDINKTKRMIFNAITPEAIIKAYSNPELLNLNHVDYEKSRQIIDRIIGFKLSSASYKYLKSRNNSVGRCQTVALKLIVEKEKEIKEFLKLNNNSFYNVNGYFDLFNNSIIGNNEINENEIQSFNNQILTFYISDLKTKEKTIKPPKPFITSSIQQAVASKFGYSIKSIMLYLQNLYENGYITYIRTDCPIISNEFKIKINDYIKNKYGEEYINKSIIEQTKEHSQNGHEAIRVTDLNKINIEDNKINQQERNIYNLIYLNTIQSQMSDYEYYETEIKIINNQNIIILYSYLDTLKFIGFKILNNQNKKYFSFKEINEIKQYYITNKNKLDYKTIDFIQSFKKPPKHFNEQKLIKKLESLGIGRPSTYSYIINIIQEREYVSKSNIQGIEKETTDYKIINGSDERFKTIKSKKIIFNENNKLIPTSKGEKIIEFMKLYFDYIIDYNYTSDIEKELDKIADGEIKYLDVLNQFWDKLNIEINKFNKLIKQMIKKDENKDLGLYNNKPVILKNGSYGFYIQYDNNTYSISEIKKDFKNIELFDVIQYINNDIGEYKNQRIKILNGRYGYYFTFDNKNYQLSKDEYNKNNDELLKLCIFKIENKKPIKIITIENKKYNIMKSLNYDNYYITIYELKNKKDKFIKNIKITTKDLKTLDNDIENIDEQFIKTKFKMN